MDSATSSAQSSARVAGVILAAGESSRMGRDKALLPFGPETFIQHLIGILRGKLAPLVVVLGHHADEIEARIAGAIRPAETAKSSAAIVLRNPDYRLGQVSSLKVALRYLLEQPVDAAMIALVDHPAIPPSIVDLLLARFSKRRSPMLVPSCRRRRGHPVIFARSLFQELLDSPLDQGARYVVERHADEIEYVETEEEGVLLDIDRPQDYEALLKRFAAGKTGVGNQEPR